MIMKIFASMACVAATVAQDYSAVNEILDDPDRGLAEQPDYVAFQKIYDEPDPFWTVMVAPGHEPKDFTTICAEAPMQDTVHCMGYPGEDSMLSFLINDAQWNKCIDEPRKAGKTPDANCLNWINWHENDGLSHTTSLVSVTQTATTMVTKVIRTDTSGASGSQSTSTLSKPTSDHSQTAGMPVQTMMVRYGASHYAPQDYNRNDTQVARRDYPLAEVRPANYPDFPPATALAYYFDVQRGMTCTHPLGGSGQQGTIYCFTRVDPRPFEVAKPEDSAKGLNDLMECYRRWELCAGDSEVFYLHNEEEDE